MRLVYFTAITITLLVMVIIGHTKTFYAGSMCINADATFVDETIGQSLPKAKENTSYNFLGAVTDQNIN